MQAVAFLFAAGFLHLALCIRGPEQIHIAYGYRPSEMCVMWSTDEPSTTLVYYIRVGKPSPWSTTTGESWKFTYGNTGGLQYMHRVNLTGLLPGAVYSYKAESNGNVSQEYNFTVMRNDSEFRPRFIVYGDMGRHGGAFILPHLRNEVKDPGNTAILHVGDFAYDLHSDGGVNGDEFMNRIQDLAAVMPYMTAVGNHEIFFNFSHYQNRFSMPTTDSKFWYSINIGPIHFVSYSSEVYFTNGPIAEQLAFLEADLAEANVNRDKQPWVIAFGHRPMYCSNLDDDDCTTMKSVVRHSLEPVMYKYGVDVIIEAHEHSYERLWPVYNETVTQKDYINPQAPVHIISGAAGCNEGPFSLCLNPMLGPKGPWSAYRSWLPGLYGYGLLQAANATHLRWEQKMEFLGVSEDAIWIVQEKHGPFN
eukprot:m.45250 g.45250  ORF g.45250 m.45250 type:complete len:419 (+) comp33576_c0_seq3:37-1293(+)